MMLENRSPPLHAVSEEHVCFERALSDGLGVYRRTVMWSLDMAELAVRCSSCDIQSSTTIHSLDFKTL